MDPHACGTGSPAAVEDAMERQSHPTGVAAPGQPDGLSALLDTERELTALLANADQEGARLVAEAHERGKALALDLQARLGDDLRALDAREEADTAAAIANAERDDALRVARLESVPDEWLVMMADVVLADFLGTAPLEPSA